jgi:hypothetical protein
VTAPGKLVVPSSTLSTPSLTPSPSTDNDASLPCTPPQVCVELPSNDETIAIPEHELQIITPDSGSAAPSNCAHSGGAESEGKPKDEATTAEHLQAPTPRPNFSRRPSYDLFECIEQSKHKRLSENNARYVFAQVVEAVYYLNSQGITHCDIKDENLVIDSDHKVTPAPRFVPLLHDQPSLTNRLAQVKLIDFGSAVVADPYAPPPYYTLFFGTTAYASSEILRKQPYRAAPAEVWTLGVLLSYLLTGHSPFPSEADAVAGRVVLRERGPGAGRLSRAALALMARCLEPDPEHRADIVEVRGHRWLQGAMERDERD